MAGLAVFSLFAVGGSLEPSAPPGPTMKTLDEVEPRSPVQTLSGSATALYVIDQPGSYYLTGNIAGEPNKSGIEIASDNVTLDLNGFALVGGPNSVDGVVMPYNPQVGYRKNSIVFGGIVRDWGDEGIELAMVKNCRLTNIVAFDNGGYGMMAGPGSTVSNCTAIDNSWTGIYMANAGATDAGCNVINCITAYNGQHGIATGGRCTIVECTSTYNTSYGIYTTYNGAVAQACTTSRNGSDGIRLEGIGSTVRNCTCSLNNGHGIYIATSGLATGNNCRENGYGVPICAGIYAYGANIRVEANNVTNNDYGIQVPLGGNIIVKNSASDNGINYNIAAGNAYGQIINVAGGGSFVNSDPTANFEF
jgi:parallel beta-helix repeat protein